MYLVTELAAFGQIQKTTDKLGMKYERNQKIYDIAVGKGKKIWPTDNISDIEIATKWIFYQVV